MENNSLEILAQAVATAIAEANKPLLAELKEIKKRLPEVPEISEEEKAISEIWDRVVNK